MLFCLWFQILIFTKILWSSYLALATSIYFQAQMENILP